jgi:hypothetical protein
LKEVSDYEEEEDDDDYQSEHQVLPLISQWNFFGYSFFSSIDGGREEEGKSVCRLKFKQ